MSFPFRIAAVPLICFYSVSVLPGQDQKTLAKESFELVWRTLQDHYWDDTMGGVDWTAAHKKYLAELALAKSAEDSRAVMQRMIDQLPSSHLAIIPGDLYKKSSPSPVQSSAPKSASTAPLPSDDEEDGPPTASIGIEIGRLGDQIVVTRVLQGMPASESGVKPGWIVVDVDGHRTADAVAFAQGEQRFWLATQLVDHWLSGAPSSNVTVQFRDGAGKLLDTHLKRAQTPGELVSFGNLPPEHVEIDRKRLPSNVEYLRLSLFLDPVRVMPEVEKAIEEARSSPGIVVDLRDNPGGIAFMAMGIAGWFVDEGGKKLGSMKGRDMSLNFVVNPRADPYLGRLAILVNEGSASTSEIFAQGMRDLDRARIFGTKTAGAALPSILIRLPNGDRLQYPNANYTSVKGRVLEKFGVEPDVEVRPSIPALLAGRDLVLEAAEQWIKSK